MQWSKHSRWSFPVAGFLAAMALLFVGTQTYAQTAAKPAQTAATKTKAKAAPYDASTCYECHESIKGFHAGSAHVTVGCNACHEGLEKHKEKARAGPSPAPTPPAAAAATRTSTARCTP